MRTVCVTTAPAPATALPLQLPLQLPLPTVAALTVSLPLPFILALQGRGRDRHVGQIRLALRPAPGRRDVVRVLPLPFFPSLPAPSLPSFCAVLVCCVVLCMPVPERLTGVDAHDGSYSSSSSPPSRRVLLLRVNTHQLGCNLRRRAWNRLLMRRQEENFEDVMSRNPGEEANAPTGE